MINGQMLLVGVHSFLATYVEFASAYGFYYKELKRIKREMVRHGISAEDFQYSKSLMGCIKRASAIAFQLNAECKSKYGCGFIVSDYPIVDLGEKEDLINEMYTAIVVDTQTAQIAK